MRSSSIFWGVILLLIGSILLLDNLGYLGDLDAWGIIWPVGLIFLGVYTLLGILLRRSAKTEQVSIPLEGASRASLKVRHGAGRLEIRAGSSLGNLLEGSFAGGVDYKSRREEDNLRVKLRAPEQGFGFWDSSTELDWRFTVNSQVPLTLDIGAGAGRAELDLTDLMLSDLKLKTGASESNLHLPAHAGLTRVRVEAGAASISLHVPEGVAGRIRVQSGLSSIRIDQDRFPKQDREYISPGFAEAANKIEIEIEAGVGSIVIS